MDAVVGVLRAGIRLGLFDADAMLALSAHEAMEKLRGTFGPSSGPLPATASAGTSDRNNGAGSDFGSGFGSGSGVGSHAGGAAHAATHSAFMRRLQALTSLAEIGSQTPTREVRTLTLALALAPALAPTPALTWPSTCD